MEEIITEAIRCVVCPFYKKNSKLTIICEGITDKSNTSQKFYDRQSYLIHRNTFCADRYRNCEIYNAIMLAKYQDDD